MHFTYHLVAWFSRPHVLLEQFEQVWVHQPGNVSGGRCASARQCQQPAPSTLACNSRRCAQGRTPVIVSNLVHMRCRMMHKVCRSHWPEMVAARIFEPFHRFPERFQHGKSHGTALHHVVVELGFAVPLGRPCSGNTRPTVDVCKQPRQHKSSVHGNRREGKTRPVSPLTWAPACSVGC